MNCVNTFKSVELQVQHNLLPSADKSACGEMAVWGAAVAVDGPIAVARAQIYS